MVPEVMFNDKGKGFMHKSLVDCTIFNDVNKGRANANGTCVVTDADGDEIFVEWKCAGVMPACPGTERFVGGTGKYKGRSGDQKSQGNFIGEVARLVRLERGLQDRVKLGLSTSLQARPRDWVTAIGDRGCSAPFRRTVPRTKRARTRIGAPSQRKSCDR